MPSPLLATGLLALIALAIATGAASSKHRRSGSIAVDPELAETLETPKLRIPDAAGSDS